MINIDDRLLDVVNENELFLLCQIARHFGKELEAWPGLSRLQKLTGWSKNKVIRVRSSIIAKKLATKEDRKNSDGSDASPIYRLTTNLMGVYISADRLQEVEDLRGVSKWNPGVPKQNPQPLQPNNDGGYQNGTPGFQNATGEGSKMEPEVLTNEVLTISSTTSAGEPNENLDQQPTGGADAFKKNSAEKSFQEAELVPDLPGSAGGGGMPECQDIRSQRIEEATAYYKDNFIGQQDWRNIRTAIGAKDGEMVDCAPAVISAGLKVPEDALKTGGKFRRTILGYARTQLRIDREALASAKDAQNGKSKRSGNNWPGRNGGSILSDDTVNAAAEAIYQSRASRPDPLA